ncbi:hypothetical protein GE061_008377 [Apolygus lucorum]|uniref:Protein aurora borealis n=1 Tax=Apolygus lucorum TaxID=248454 RepID=A0A8S9WTA1_APOLU|nr:hypothetical protein GE061_008377 [Apolygus lucorum]
MFNENLTYFQQPEHFFWSIDEISRIQPADINSPQSIPEEYDEGKESLAQEAIEKYFSSTHSILSPADAYQGTWRSPNALSTPSAPSSARTISSTPTTKSRIVLRSDAGSQTKYSFPPVLPPEVEEILKPYFSEIELQGNVSVDSEDQLLNTSTLRRKLFFNKGDEDLSPVKFSGSHFTPSPRKNIVSRIEWSSEKRKFCDNDSVPSSPDLSPIRTKHDIEMSLGSPDISAITNAEVSMVTVDSNKGPDDMEEMVSTSQVAALRWNPQVTPPCPTKPLPPILPATILVPEPKWGLRGLPKSADRATRSRPNMSDQHSDQDMDLEDLSPNETKLLDRSDSMRPVNAEELDAWKKERGGCQDQTDEDQDIITTTTINLRSMVDDEGYDYDARRPIMAANDLEHWRTGKDEPKDENLEISEDERIIRLPSENEVTDMSLVQESITSNGYDASSQTLLPTSSDCLNFSQRDREAAYAKHAEVFENWNYSDEERAFLRHRVETFSREQCIIHCILGHMLMTPDEMLGARQTGLKPDDARQALLCLAVGSHWDVYNLAIIMAFSEKLNVLLRLSGDGLYRNLLEEPRSSIENQIKVHVLEDTATPYLLYSNLQMEEEEEELREDATDLEEVNDMAVGDWVLVQFLGKKTIKHYVGEIIEFDKVLPHSRFKMKKKVDTSQKDVVGGIMNELLVDTSHFITTGVPPHILVSKLADSLAQRNGDSDVTKFQKKAKELIELEVKNETLVRFPSGNYLHGPRKNDDGQSAVSGEESDSVPMSGEEEEVDDEEEEDEDEEDHHSKKDTDYSPNYVPKNLKRTMKRGEGRTSGRMKKSRFDSDEYIFPTIVKNLNKKSPAAAQEKPRKRPGPKPKKKCPICSLYTSGNELVNSSCKTCPIKAHLSCVEKETSAKGQDISNWTCCYCKPIPKKWKCTTCDEGASKDMGILVTCESCSLKYHKTCHSPTILAKQIKNWKCLRCAIKPSPAGRGKDSGEANSTRSKDTADSSLNLEDSDDDVDNLDFTQRCYVCHNKFYNAANKLKCAECRYLFHTRCCRVKTAENAARLGSKRHKWKCDECRFSTAGSKKKGRLVESKPTTGRNESTQFMDVGAEGQEIKEEKVLKVFSSKDRKEWWAGRLRPIVVGNNQPALGPIPDLSVPDATTWNSVLVAKYFDEYFLDKSVGRVFVDQDIDGKALKLMRRIDVLKTFDLAGFKIDIIMDVMQHVKRLQLRVNDRRYIWADIF